jgi:S1-C subfamily serine protease
MTNRHVIYGCGTVEMETAGTTSAAIKVIAEDSNEDLAVLQEQTSAATPTMEFRSPDVGFSRGDRVVVLGYPLPNELGSLNSTFGNISSIVGPNGDERLFQMQAPIQGGNSGGPVLDERGHVIGIAVSVLNVKEAQNVNFAVKGDRAARFAQSVGVPIVVGADGTQLSDGEIVARAGSLVVKLRCYS